MTLYNPQFCPDGRIIEIGHKVITQIPQHIVVTKVQMTYFQWLAYLAQLKK